MPQPAERDLPHHGDGRGVQQLGRTRAGERGPDQDFALLVDDEPGPALVAVRGQGRPGDVTDLVVGGADRPALAATPAHPTTISPTKSPMCSTYTRVSRTRFLSSK